ncbi:MAG: hypothetical protein GY765_22050 [bacterium]|nr:hypothetical protein [bacterium]
MEQIEVISWKTLDGLKNAATNIEDVIGDLDTNEQMAVFCAIEEDYLELYYSELEGNYVRRFDDEEDMRKQIEQRKSEFGEHEFDSVEYYDDDIGYNDQGNDEDLSGYKIGEEDDEADY